MADGTAVRLATRRVFLPSGAPPLCTDMPPFLGHDGSSVVAELEASAPRGPWAVIDVASGRAGVGRRMPQIRGALLDGDGAALLGTAGGVIEVDLSGPSTVRELREGVGRGRDDAETEFVRLDGRHVLVGAVGKQTAKLIDLDRWAVVRVRIPVTPPWVVLEGPPARIWSLPRGEVITLDASHKVLRRTTAPAAIAAVRSAHGVFALVGQLRPHRGTGWLHAIGRDLLPTGLQHHLSTPLDGVTLCKLHPDTLDVMAARGLGALAQLVEGALSEILADREEWTSGSVQSCLSTDSVGRPVLLADNCLVVLDHKTLEPVIEARLSDDGPFNWVSRNGLSRAVAITGDAVHIADW